MATARDDHRPARVRGVPLTVKLTLGAGLLVALFMAGFRLVLLDTMEDTIRSQIVHEAVSAARTAAQVDLDVWTWSHHTIDEGLDGREIQARVDEQTPEQFAAYANDSERLARVAWNRARLERLLGDETRLLAMEVFRWVDGRRGGTVASIYPTDASDSLPEYLAGSLRAPVNIGRGVAEEGTLTVGERSWYVIRGSYPILGPGDVQTGEVVVHVDGADIAAASQAFDEQVAYAGAGLLAVCMLVAYLLARGLTRPVQRLRADAAAVLAGNLHHHALPHSHDEIGQLAQTFDSLRRWLAEAEALEAAAEHEAEGYRDELAAAADVTASLFPRELPSLPGWSLGGLHDREAAPGGGLYDVLRMPDGKLGIVVAETSAGGAPGALVAAMLRSTVRLVAERESDPGSVLREVDARLAPDLGPGLNVAIMLVVIEPASGKAVLANAGHRPLLHHHAAGDTITAVSSGGPALGSVDAATFDEALQVGSLRVEPGDTLVLFASQISNLAAPDGELLGERRLASLVKQAAGLPADRLVTVVGDTLRKYHGGESLGADVTLVAIGRDAGA